MIAKNKKTAAPVTATEPEPEEVETSEGSEGEDNGSTSTSTPEPSWDYALIGKLSHQVHSFDELVSALAEHEGFERNRSAVANQVRRMLTIASNPNKPLPGLINPEVKPNSKPRIDWEGIAAKVSGQSGEEVQAAG